MSLRLVVVNYGTAAGFNRAWHRTHRKAPPGHKFSIGVATDDDELRRAARAAARGDEAA